KSLEDEARQVGLNKRQLYQYSMAHGDLADKMAEMTAPETQEMAKIREEIARLSEYLIVHDDVIAELQRTYDALPQAQTEGLVEFFKNLETSRGTASEAVASYADLTGALAVTNREIGELDATIDFFNKNQDEAKKLAEDLGISLNFLTTSLEEERFRRGAE